jgi:hypothetical protein
MAQSITTGLRDVYVAQANITPEQVLQNKIDLLTKDKAAWTLLTRAAQKHKATGDWTFYIFQDLLVKTHTLLTSTAAVAATTWNVTTGTGDYIAAWDILWNRTRNVFVHVESTSTDAITVIANIDSGTDVQGEVGDEIVVLTNTNQEANNIPRATTTVETRRTNYVQDIITAWDFSDMAMFSDSHFDQKDVDYQQMKIAVEHQRKLERALKLGPLPTLFTPTPGSAYENPVSLSTFQAGLTQSFRALMDTYADGDHLVTENDLTESEFVEKCIEPYFYAEQEGANKKKGTMFVPPRFSTGITLWNIARGTLEARTSKAKVTLGMSFTRWNSPFGPIDMVIDHDLQSSVSGGTHYIFMVATDHIGYTPYRNLDTHTVENAIKDGRRRVVGYIRTVMGSHYAQENAHVKVAFKTTS